MVAHFMSATEIVLCVLIWYDNSELKNSSIQALYCIVNFTSRHVTVK